MEIMDHTLETMGFFVMIFIWLTNLIFISNRVSELRVVELLDGLCEKMQDYTLEEVGFLFGELSSISQSAQFSLLP